MSTLRHGASCPGPSVSTAPLNQRRTEGIVIAGAGFAGLTTIKTLRRLGYEAPITLLAPRPERVYYPAFIWGPAGLNNAADVHRDLTGFIRRYQVDYVAGEITGLEAKAKRLHTTLGDMDYQRLVIATGGSTSHRLPGQEHVIIPCRDYGSVMDLAKRLAVLKQGTLAFGFSGNPDEPTAIRGEPLFEFLFGIDTLLRRQRRRDRFDLVFFTPLAVPDARWGTAMGTLEKELKRRSIRCLLSQPLQGFSAGQVLLGSGDLNTDLTVFLPELVGPTWVAHSDLPQSVDGFIQADAQCRVLGYEESVYVAGDAGHFPGSDWVPKHGHTADLQAEALARTLYDDLKGKKGQHYFRQEFIYIVDTLDGGILIFRNATSHRTLKSPLLHWAKRLFVWGYLRS